MPNKRNKNIKKTMTCPSLGSDLSSELTSLLIPTRIVIELTFDSFNRAQRSEDSEDSKWFQIRNSRDKLKETIE